MRKFSIKYAYKLQDEMIEHESIEQVEAPEPELAIDRSRLQSAAVGQREYRVKGIQEICHNCGNRMPVRS